MASLTERILVVDPDPSIRALLVALVRRSGIQVECAGDRDTALELSASQHYTAFIVEPRMVNGDALLAELHPDDGPANIIIATTPDVTTPMLARRPGVRTVLLKPFRLEELYATIAACCQ